MASEDDLIGYKEIAQMARVQPSTLRGLRARGEMPPPDVMLADRPRWRPATIRAWLASRPGQGTRTDLQKTRASGGDAPAGPGGTE